MLILQKHNFDCVIFTEKTMKKITRLIDSYKNLELYEKLHDEAVKSINSPDPLSTLKRQERTYAQYISVYRKKYQESLQNVLADMGQ